MKPLIKTVAIRKGGLAAQIDDKPSSLRHEPRSDTMQRLNRSEARSSPRNAEVPSNPVANPVANVANKPRYAKWREANPELWLERQRAAQKRYRAKKRAEKQPN